MNDDEELPIGFEEGAVYRSLFAAYPDALLLVDSHGVIALANPAAASLLGYTTAELTGLAVEALVPEGVRSRHAKDTLSTFAAINAVVTSYYAVWHFYGRKKHQKVLSSLLFVANDLGLILHSNDLTKWGGPDVLCCWKTSHPPSGTRTTS